MTTDEFNLKLLDYENMVKRFFPNWRISNSEIYDGSAANPHGSLDFSLSSTLTENSVYSKNLGKEYIHFTSLEALCNIINEGCIRLYNLNKKNDIEEFSHLIKKYNLKIDEDEINLFKRSFHLLSMCRYDGDISENSTLWNIYGTSGKGVGLVFELTNIDWKYFVIGNVQYHNSFEAEENICSIINYSIKQRPYINLERLPIAIASLPLLHKNKIWEYENEVRMFSYIGYNEYTLTSMHDFNTLDTKYLRFTITDGKTMSYLPLYFEHKLKELNPQFYYLFPLLKIKKVIAGPKMDGESFWNLQKFIINYNNNLDQKIETVFSGLNI